MGREDFLLKDYELKARYLTDHFSRMWVRFNFFLTIESALVVLSFQKSEQVKWLSCLGGVLALVWFHFGRTDNFLADFYRNQVGIAFDLLSNLKGWTEENRKPPELLFVGNVKDDESIRQTLLSGRWRRLSATELAAFLPLVYFVTWIIRLSSTYFPFPSWI